MPNRDGTGPEGKGPRTGRGAGNCVSSDKATEGRPRDGRGKGQGLGRKGQSN